MTDKIMTVDAVGKGWGDAGVYLVCGALMVVVLMLDLAIPLGVAVGVLYVAAVLISLWSSESRATLIVAAVCSLLAIAAFFYKPVVAEMWKVIFNRAISLFAIWVTALLGLQRRVAEQKRELALLEREKALEDVRILRGLLPICASCKRIRNVQGAWVQIEGYIRDHSEAEFSHGICDECAKKLYPEIYSKMKKEDS